MERINKFKTIKEVEDYRSKVNELCEHRIKFIKTCETADNLSNKTFGYIKESFESLSPELFKSKEGKKLLNKYTRTIKESKNLLSLHSIHENIRKASKDTDVDFFMESIINMNWDSNKEKLSEDIKKLGRVLAEGYLYLGEKANKYLPSNESEMKKLSLAVNYIFENKKQKNNITEYSDAVKVIKEYVNNNDSVKNIFEVVNIDEMATKLINDFNIKYADKLTEEEIKIIKEINSCSNQEEIFNKYKESCISKITEAKNNFEAKGDKESTERLSIVLEQISNKNYVSENIGNDICSLIELTKVFES